MSAIDELSLHFRERYLTYSELTEQLHRWAKAFPGTMRLESLGKSEEGRDLWLATVGRDPERIRPAVWIDGNIHASELAGSSVALAILEDLLRAHAEPAAPVRDLPRHLGDLLREDVLFYVLPRMCPDGAERVLDRHHFVRSNPRDHRLGRTQAHWRRADVDGDGKALLMRRRDVSGDFAESHEHPGLLLPRRVEDEGPFYRIYPEGFIDGFDGFHVPVPSFMSDTETDMNRNFPSSWQAEPMQVGAGAYATSEPESRAVTEFAVRHPNIFAWVAYHTFGGVYIRPLGDKPDTKMDSHDASVFRLLEQWGDEITGYPTVSGFHEFTYEPEKPLYGDCSNFAYVERGAVGFVCELWDFFKQVGFEVKRPFIKNYEDRVKREDILRMAAWDKAHNEGRIVGTWRAFEHPQIGPVEIGGYDPLIGVWNPPLDRLAEVCDQQSRFVLRVASMSPRLGISALKATELGGSLYRVEAVVENRGYLPTYVLGSSKARPWNDPVHATILLGSGLTLESGNAVEEVGHLAGWGGNDRSTSPILAQSTVAFPRRRLTWVVRGSGALTLRAAAARVGQVERTLEIG